MLQVQLTLFENPGITGKIELLLQHGRQYETNSKETAVPFLDQNVFLLSVRKDSHIVKALIFVTEAVPYCFHWFPQSEVAVCKQKAEIWTALNNNKYNGVKRISRLEKVYFWVVKIKLKRSLDILIETSNVWRLQRSTAREKPNTPQLLWQNWLVVI